MKLCSLLMLMTLLSFSVNAQNEMPTDYNEPTEYTEEDLLEDELKDEALKQRLERAEELSLEEEASNVGGKVEDLIEEKIDEKFKESEATIKADPALSSPDILPEIEDNVPEEDPLYYDDAVPAN